MNKPIRILHVVQRMEAGGTQALLMNIYRNIDRTKVQFDFLVEYPNKEFYDDEILKLGGKIYYSTVRTDFNILKFKNQLKNILRENPDYKIMHVHVSNIGYICFKIAKKMGVHTRIAHAHNNGSVHDAKYFFRWILRKLFALYATDYYACSKEAGEYFFKGKDYKVLNNAIDSERFVYNDEIRKKKRKELELENSFLVGHIGRFEHQKNHDFLVRVFSAFLKIEPKAKLLLIGTGSLRQKIENEVQQLGISGKVLFLGVRKDISQLLWGMDAFLFPSFYEGLSVVAIEAQAAGVPILASDKISEETKIAECISFYPLEKSADEWAGKLYDICRIGHKNTLLDIKRAGYDIHDTSSFMASDYIRIIKKN